MKIASRSVTPSEQWLYSLGGGELIVSSMAEKRPVITVKGMEAARSAAVHPLRKFAVIAFQDRLGIVDLEKRELIKQLWINRKTGTFDPFATISFETKEQPFDVRFHPNGEQLFVASKGMRVFDWGALLCAMGDAPSPDFSVDAPRDDESDLNSRPLAYCLRFDEERNLLLSSCLAGVVQYLDFANGKSAVLLKPPGEMAIWRLELTSDKQALCCHCLTRPSAEDRNKRFNCVQVWNYPALCKAAGIA